MGGADQALLLWDTIHGNGHLTVNVLRTKANDHNSVSESSAKPGRLLRHLICRGLPSLDASSRAACSSAFTGVRPQDAPILARKQPATP